MVIKRPFCAIMQQEDKPFFFFKSRMTRIVSEVKGIVSKKDYLSRRALKTLYLRRFSMQSWNISLSGATY